MIVDKLYHATARLDERTPCILLPSVHGDPHVVVKHVPGHPVVVQYPAMRNTATVPVGQVQRRMAVLGGPDMTADLPEHPAPPRGHGGARRPAGDDIASSLAAPAAFAGGGTRPDTS
ncbi:hypothetical protein GCM10010255_36700 [Streptomyces coeruleofuscus]|uniref:DUF5937 domain-containing protein n=1 Tax=Streptomyces coeruleofuscus TaxID=66879 RepID=A0ABP5VH69_9ACTN